jgi:hypothetical protein
VRLGYRDEKVFNEYRRKLCSKTWARGIYLTHRTATKRENLGIWARDSLIMRKGALRCMCRRHGECKRHGVCYGLGMQVVVNADMQ